MKLRMPMKTICIGYDSGDGGSARARKSNSILTGLLEARIDSHGLRSEDLPCEPLTIRRYWSPEEFRRLTGICRAFVGFNFREELRMNVDNPNK